MEIKVKREDFLKALSFTQNVAERKTTMPILANVLLDAGGKKVTVNATDLEVGILIDCPAEVLAPGRITVLSRSLFDIIKELPDSLVHIEVLNNNWLKIKCGRSDFKIVGMSAEEFPIIKMKDGGEVYTESGDDLLEMIAKSSFAMSTDETRYNLNGVCLQEAKNEGVLRMVATDGHRLVVVERKIKSKWNLGKGAIIPKKGVLELKKLLEAYEGDFSFRMDDKNLAVEKEGAQLIIRLIDGQFPPYEQVIPKDCNRVAVVDKAEFGRALRRVALMANDRTKGVKVSLSPGHLEVSTSNPDFGEAKEDLEVSYKGETFSVGFNARYFMDVLGVLQDEKAVLELKDDVSPCLIRSECDKGLTNVIMPMRI